MMSSVLQVAGTLYLGSLFGMPSKRTPTVRGPRSSREYSPSVIPLQKSLTTIIKGFCTPGAHKHCPLTVYVEYINDISKGTVVNHDNKDFCNGSTLGE